MIFRAGQFRYEFPRPTLIMGVLNVTPDSFADGNRYFAAPTAIERGVELAFQGADIIDVGGESTRPGATPVPEAEELRRVLPVIEALASRLKVALSVDTQKPAVARAAVAAGASIVNDIAANRDDTAMAEFVASTGAGYVCMHMQGTPQTMQQQPRYGDVVAEVGAFFAERLARLKAAGVAAEQVVLDPGFGFGKTPGHNLELLRRLAEFRTYTRPLLLGLSRKSFLGALLGAETAARLPGSLAGACWAVSAGAQILRTHDVAETIQAVRLTGALLARPDP